MSELRITFEECARRILQRELGQAVILHDDGSEPGIYDLRVGSATEPAIAIECVGAVDRKRTEMWNIGPAEGPLQLNLSRDWNVVLGAGARVKTIRSEMEQVLQTCEATSLAGFTPVDWFLQRRNPDIFAALSRLRITSIACFGDPGTGKVHLGMTGVGGAVDPYGAAVPGWIAEFLRAPDRMDVLQKLERSRATSCQVFVSVALAGGAPWSVESYLGTRTEHHPTGSPDLPPPVDAVWIMYNRRGLHWDGLKWRLFDAIVPAA